MNFKQNESSTKLRGGYYTSLDIARFLVRWVAAKRPRCVLEPACGDGVFFRAMASVGLSSLQRVLAFEIESAEAAKARQAAELVRPVDTQIFEKDFLGWTLSNVMHPPCVDAVLGNPPFIRYQYLDDVLQQRAEKLFALFRLPFTRHTNAWVPFVVGSLGLLQAGGRLAMVVPAEILHVLHAQGLRSFLAKHCSRVLILDPEELWFENTLQGAVLLLAEKKACPTDVCLGVCVRPVRSRQDLELDPEELFTRAEYSNGDALLGKWMVALLSRSQRDVLREARNNERVSRFSDVADVDVGIVTGANKFFLVPDNTVEEFGVQDWAHPMFGRSEHVPGIIYNRAVHERNRSLGLPTNFLWFSEPPKLSGGARRYIGLGEKAGLHTRYKCRVRDPWYVVPSVYTTPVGMLKRCHNFPRLILNKLGAYTTDTAYRIRPKEGIAATDLVFSFVNSLTALSAELEGRHYGGGVLELVPSEIERMLVPLTTADEAELSNLDARVAEAPDPESLLRTQDHRVLAQVGFGATEITTIEEALASLRARRHRTPAQQPDAQLTTTEYGAPLLAGA